MKNFKIVLLVLFCASILSAQSTETSGSVKGTVRDAEGAPLPGVTVTAAGPKEMGTPSVITGPDGNYRFVRLTPGVISITAALNGFNTMKQENVLINAGVALTLNFVLKPSAIHESITVTATAPVVDVISNAITKIVNTEDLVRMPLARHIEAVVNMMPSARAEKGWDGTYGGEDLIAGGMANGINWTVEGIKINNPNSNLNNVINFDFDTLAEVEVVSGSAPASSSATSGTYVNVITKSGSNEFHGHIQGYYTNKHMYKSLFDEAYISASGLPVPNRPKYEMQASGSLGGPIIKDKMWFFANVGLLDTESQGSFTPITILGKFYGNYPDSRRDINGFLKLTTQLNPAMRLFAQLNIQNMNRNDFGAGSYYATVDASFDQKNKMQTFGSANLTWTLNQYSILDLKLGYVNSNAPQVMQPGIDGKISLTDGYIPGATSTYRWNAPYSYNQESQQNSLQMSARFTQYLDSFLGGDHEIVLGVEVERSLDRFSWYRDKPINWAWYGGSPYYHRKLYNLNAPHALYGDGYIEAWYCGPSADNSKSQANQNRFGAYLQDSMTIGNRLTVNVGLRLDYRKGYLPPTTKAQTTGLPYEIGQVVHLPQFGFNPMAKLDYPGFDKALTWSTLSPRIGLSYDLFGNGKTAIKASIARYGDAMPLQFISGLHPFRPQLFSYYWWDSNGNEALDSPGIDTYTYRSGSVANMDYNLAPSKVAPDVKSPTWDEFTAGLNHELFPNTNFGLRFLFKKKNNHVDDVRYDPQTKRLWYTYEQAPDWYVPFNVVWPGVGGFGPESYTIYYTSNNAPWDRVFTQFRNVPEAKYKYYSIEVTWDKRHINGWSFGGSIVYAQARGNVPAWSMYMGGYTPVFNEPNWTVNNGPNAVWDSDKPWVLKVYGAADIPLGILASFAWRGWSGNVSNSQIGTTAPNSWIQENNVRPGTIYVYFRPLDGKYRRDFQNYLDVRLEKQFRVFTGQLGFFVDVFNLLGYRWAQLVDTPGGTWSPTGNGTSTGTYTNVANFGRLWRLTGTRDFRLSIRYAF